MRKMKGFVRRSRLLVAIIAVLTPNISSCLASAFLFAPSRTSLLIPRQPSPSCRSSTTDNRRNVVQAGTARSGGRRGIRPVEPSRTALEATLMPQMAAIGSGVVKFYKAFPLAAGFLTASTKASFADSMAQYRDVCTTKFNVKRNLAMMLYSGLILGITCELMYNKLFPILFGTGEQCVARAIKMTLFDGFVNAPLLWLPPAYIAQAIVYRYPKREAIQKYITDVRENGLLKKYWSLWLPMSMINFLLIPAHFRVLFVAAVSFFWMIILSIVANNEQPVESCPAEPEPAMLNPRALD